MPPTSRSTDDEAILHEARLVRIEGAVESLTVAVKATNSNVDTIMGRVSSFGKTNWTLMIAAGAFMLSIVIPLMTVAFFITKLSTESLIAPLQSRSEVSILERSENRQDIHDVNLEVISIQKEIAAIKPAIGHLETQDKALESFIALGNAEMHRLIAPTFHKVWGIPMAEGPHHFPTISKQSEVQPK
jgi:hypothetical protein